ncbi:MAG: prepilin peptidase [Candidatus Gottesmanbacteria bacterium]|nr:prepilin peptidase [Candidatus Gottesmanbacteria bacterium]
MMELIVFIFGLAVGSFLNVLIDRLPRGEDVITGRSVCDHCKKVLRWYELIPLLSFFLQRGRCRRCHEKLFWQYPVVELVTAVGFVYLQSQALEFPQSLALVGWLLFFCSLLVIFVADFKYQIIPDSMVIIGIVGVLLQGQALWLSALGAGGFFFLLWLVTRGKGMGLGDVKFAFLMGLLLGFPNIIVASYLAFLTGAVVGVILILTGKTQLRAHIAFGPFLVLGTIIALGWGKQLIQWWMNIL